LARSIESTGKTVDEAIFNGLDLLGMEIDQVDIDILDEGSRGLFGIGSSRSRVCLTVREEPELPAKAKEFVAGVLERLGLEATMEVQEEEGILKIRLKGQELGMLIGRRGETLDALQYLTGLAVNKGGEYKRIQLDIEDYRSSREETLQRLASRLAGKVARTGERVVLEPMNPYERRVMHAALQNNPQVTTISEGEEPNRRVTILPRPKQ
jgi:spoIIIJ-associated protein